MSGIPNLTRLSLDEQISVLAKDLVRLAPQREAIDREIKWRKLRIADVQRSIRAQRIVPRKKKRNTL